MGEINATASQAPAETEASISFSKLQASPPLVLKEICDSLASQGDERSTSASVSPLRVARTATPIILRFTLFGRSSCSRSDTRHPNSRSNSRLIQDLTATPALT